MIAKTPNPPYYAVIFSSERTDVDDGYAEMAQKMMELAALQDGFLGVDTARSEVGLTVSYWKDLESIEKWRQNAAHGEAKVLGMAKWYKEHITRIAKVEHAY